jgi:adenosylhomocysteine nucleosidase
VSVETNILVCFALREEAGAFHRFAGDRPELSILITGIGQRNAEAAVGAGLKIHLPRLVLTCGFAGALNPALVAGDVVFSTDDAELRKRLLAAGAKPAKFVFASKIATTVAKKQELRRTTGAEAVEMESEVIQGICRERGIPCATVRVISDTANEDLPLDFNMLSKADQSLNYARLALAIAKSPGKIPALLRLRKNCKFAAERLAEVLHKVLNQG